MNLVNRDGLYGVIVPILTPLNGDETVDTGSLRRLVNYMIEGGVHGIWAAGTTGEFAALDDEQKLLAIETVVDEVAGRVPVIGNISAPSTNLTVRLARAVQEWGLAGIAATPPYYYPCEQDEVIAHFRYIKEQSGVPLWVYNIPVTVKTVVEPQTMAALAGEGTVVGVKDSSGAGEAFAQLRALCDQGGIEMYRFLGSVFRVTTASAVGAHGVIPGIANLAPGVVAKAWEAGEAGDIRDGTGLPGQGDGRDKGHAPCEGGLRERRELLGDEVGPAADGRDRQRQGHEAAATAHRGREEGYTGHPARSRYLAGAIWTLGRAV